MKNFYSYRQVAGRPGGRSGHVQAKDIWLVEEFLDGSKDGPAAAERPVSTLEEVLASRGRLASCLQRIVDAGLEYNRTVARELEGCLEAEKEEMARWKDAAEAEKEEIARRNAAADAVDALWLNVRAEVLNKYAAGLKYAGTGERKLNRRMTEAEALLNDFCARMQNRKGDGKW